MKLYAKQSVGANGNGKIKIVNNKYKNESCF